MSVCRSSGKPVFIRSPAILLSDGECTRVEFQYFVEMGQEIRGAMIAGIEMKFMFNAFGLQLPVKRFSAILKAELVVIAAVEIDGQLCNTRAVLFRQHKGAVLVPVRNVNRITEHRAEHSAEWRS